MTKTTEKSMLKASDSIAKLAGSLAKAQGAMRAALKDSVNPHFRSRYADLAGVWDACREPLASNGLAVIQTPGEIGDKTIELTTILAHESGEWIQSTFTIPVSKPDAQGVGSAVTYARRYALAAMVGIVQDDDDGNAATGPAPRKQVTIRRPDATEPEPAPQGRPFNLDDALVAVRKAENLDVLKAVYTDAYNAADALGDDAGIAELIKAKDERKAALATKGSVPSKVKAAMAKAAPAVEAAPAPEQQDDVPFGDKQEDESGPF
jgi:hypothetical protein